jgi:hypothetical protein
MDWKTCVLFLEFIYPFNATFLIETLKLLSGS